VKERLSISIIDIDLIAFDEEIINSEKLQIPHPLMQDRKFVLLPIQDLNLDWKHPILKKHLRVIRGFPDKSICEVVKTLKTHYGILP
jgi:7,8-dihydro-6-hydroxymethylpterin-pyrophosphokinase